MQVHVVMLVPVLNALESS